MEETHTYIIEYCVYFGIDNHRTGEIKVKNCMSNAHAKVKLEKYLSRKTTDFKKLVVYECTKDISGIFDFLDNIWK